jgi:hypothetical protein
LNRLSRPLTSKTATAKKKKEEEVISESSALNALSNDAIVLETFCSWLAEQPAGEVKATDMGLFYKKYPFLKGKIGKISTFCKDNSEHLKFEARKNHCGKVSQFVGLRTTVAEPEDQKER